MLAPGQRLEHYELVEKIGEGGMGVVWRATDTTLGRSVAIKVLPEEVARDGERLARFEREAKLLASLNHRNIATIHGLGSVGGVTFLAMELIEGDELGARLRDGPLPVEEALAVAGQLAEALEAAHGSGVIHRDLKPANIKITADGTVKVLDFGLAKALAPGGSDPSSSLSPTVTTLGSAAGVILGTASYMSPEQARGRPADRRADVFAFGCVLYEMLTGRRLFQGETISDTLASVLKVEPDWGRLPADTPAAIRRLLRRCLQKSPKDRLHDAADARIVLDEVRGGVMEEAAAAARPVTSAAWRRLFPWAVAGLLAATVIALLLGRAASAPKEEARLAYVSVDLTEEAPLRLAARGFAWPDLHLAPDGRRVVYISAAEGGESIAGGRSRLWVRDLDDPRPRPLAGTEGANAPFLSPDGDWVGFFVGPQMKKVSISGQTTVDICSTPGVFGSGSWGPDGTIVFNPGLGSGLYRVPAGGGEPQVVAIPDREKGEVSYRHPRFLPDGRAVLFVLKTAEILDFDEARIAALSLETGEVRTLVEGGMAPRYLPTGHVGFIRDGALLAVPFDPRRLEVLGTPSRIMEGIALDQSTGIAHYDVSDNGWLVYIPGPSLRGRYRISWADRSGKLTPALDEIRHYQAARLSPDGRRMVVAMPGANNKLWLLDRERQVLRRLTFGPGNDSTPLWSPDGEWIVFSSDRAGPNELFRVRTDGTGEEERLLPPGPLAQFPQSFGPDGTLLLYVQVTEAGGSPDLWTLAWGTEPPRPAPLMESRFAETNAAISPDGRWLAYTSDESGEQEIYVQAFPDGGQKVPVTRAGGGNPMWSRDGRELFFATEDAWWAVPFDAAPAPGPGPPRLLFAIDQRPPVDISLDGQRFLVIEEAEPIPPATHVQLIQDWSADVRRRMGG